MNNKIISPMAFLLAFSLLAPHSLLAEQETQIPVDTASRTLAMKEFGIITDVYWRIDKSNYIVQINFPSRPMGTSPMPIPKIQVWLLNADGTSIKQSNQSKTNTRYPPGIGLHGSISPFLMYVFPASAASEPVAVVVSINGKLLTESLRSTPYQIDLTLRPPVAPKPR